MADNLTFPQLLDSLTDLIDKKRSGTLYIRSNCNHVITFAIDAGRIFAIFHGPRRGRKAIPLISQIAGGSFKFESTELTGVSHELPSTPEILNMLRTKRTGNAPQPTVLESGSDASGISEENKSLLCQQLKGLLAVHLGPIAEMVFDEAINESADFCATSEQALGLIDKLSSDIDDAAEIAQFKSQAFEAINKMLGY